MLIQLKGNTESMIITKQVILQIHCQFVAIMLCCTLEQLIYLGFRQFNRQNPVFEAVIVEDIGIRRGNDDPEAIIHNGPRRMLT
ncbi:hypothetical protein D3C73_743200 [compost metagenome]